ncbi:CelD/BcsL family acetyltransferase involved in cellulose biosynthesis [Streptosporangium becharense]|uniref:CelD/BcsL family acetyltransferase involved in cellulose biosynthesis n=1 Tax=Streptosporangium becharense TaxID=1816182 RepID=A0A7W9MGH6_9ACTN|nr:GNAT family N-acetyltransferase [Streptosporangium becharense]MBB2909116.1 CelD/BcsL family acetyltransferase involved in cellulose biosynthesis [Streptosporangium becharense]MBB5819865.1 CelD/BcsL family acetyltransferase involved in cellulose biosynthesis [Streptosporangium becharense]
MDGATSAAARAVSVRTVGFDELGERELSAWHGLRAANPLLDSPYFHPGFSAAVHASGCRVLVAVGRDASGEVRSLFPHHRERSVIRPVGWPGADFQGPITAPGSAFDPVILLTGGVRALAFDHLVDGLPGFQPWIESRRVSPFADVSGGLDGYLGRASRSGRDNMGQARRRAARAERTYGPVRFAADTVDAGCLDRLVALKRAQYAATGARDYFTEPGRRELLARLLHTRGRSFAGVLSTLHVGPHLVAAHFGIRSGGVLHWWFPVYDPAFSHLSPGWMLLRELVAASPALGVTRLDFGRGADEYKRRAKTGETLVCEGYLSRNPAGRAFRKMHRSMVAAMKTSTFGPGVRRILKKVRAIKR